MIALPKLHSPKNLPVESHTTAPLVLQATDPAGAAAAGAADAVDPAAELATGVAGTAEEEAEAE
jgi:hypothetical protein